MILKRSLKGLEYLHAALLFVMPVPLIYAAAKFSDPAGTGALYLKCLLIIIPVIVTERAVKCVKSPILYFIICAVLLAGIIGIAAFISYMMGQKGSIELNEKCYCAVMSAETLFIAVKRFMSRVKDAKMKREEPLAAREVSFLDHPTHTLICYFAAFYVLGLCLNAKLLCDIAFFNAFVYIFLALIYEYFEAMKGYLNMNKRTRGIPKRRLYGISFSMFLVFAVMLLVGMMPAVFMADKRPYTDIREWFGEVELVPYEYENDMGFQSAASGGADMMELFNDGQPAPEPSKVANALLWGIGTVCVLAFMYGIFQVIRQVLLDFRNNRDENGDLVEELKDDQPFMQRESMLDKKGHPGYESEAERIRRKYRKTIRKHRKEKPAPYESPTEIETYAGLKDDEQMQQLHRKYEEVRYGKQ